MRRQFLRFFLSLLLVACSKDSLPGDNEGGVVYEYPPNTLPLVAIYTQNVAIPDEPKIRANLKISERGEPLFEGPVGIETRGQSSQYFYPKKQYGFETRSTEDFELDVDVSLLGISSALKLSCARPILNSSTTLP